MRKIWFKGSFTFFFVFLGFIFLFVPKVIYAGCTAYLPDTKCYKNDPSFYCYSLNCQERCINITGGSAGVSVDGYGSDSKGDYCWFHVYSCTSRCTGNGSTQCTPPAGESNNCGSQNCCDSATCCSCGCKSTSNCAAACCSASAAKNLLVTPISSTNATVTWTPGSVSGNQYVYVGTDINQVLNNCSSSNSCVVNAKLSKTATSYTTGNVLTPNTLYYWSVVSFNNNSCNKYAMVPALSSCNISPASLNLVAGQSAQLETLTGGLTGATVTYADEGNSVSFNPAVTQNFNTPVSLDASADGGNSYGGTTVSTTISTSNGNDLLVASISTDSSTRTVSSVTSSGLNWIKLSAQTAGTSENLELWYAYSTGTLSNEVITATLSSSGHAAIGVVAYSNAASVNGILNLVSTTGSGKSVTGDVTPSYSGSLIVGSLGVALNPHVTFGSGFTNVAYANARTSGLIAVEDRNSNTADSEVGTSMNVPFSWDASNVYSLMTYEISPVISASTLNATTVTAYSAGSNKISSTVTQNGTYLCSSTIPYTTITAGPHWQAKDGDVTTNGDLLTGVSSGDFFDLPGNGGYPGVPMYAGSTDLKTTDVSTNPPFGWLANSPYSASRLYNSTYFLNAVPSDVATVLNDNANVTNASVDGSFFTSGGILDRGYYYYEYDGTKTGLPLTISSNVSLGDRKVILIVNGADLNIAGNINFTKGAGFFLGVTSGNINIDPSVGGGATANLEGVYVADGTFNTGTGGTKTDSELWIRGSVAAYGGVNLQRELADNSNPSELFEYAPDIELMFPTSLANKPSVWREVAP